MSDTPIHDELFMEIFGPPPTPPQPKLPWRKRFTAWLRDEPTSPTSPTTMWLMAEADARAITKGRR